jgi:hypothetical protein
VLIGAAASTAGAQWTVTNLHPAGMFGSRANGVGGGQQVGYAQEPTLGNPRASLWSDTAASWVNLAPAATPYSLAYGADAGQQVGEVYTDGFPRASLWSGTAASWVNLHPAGPPTNSSAFGVGGGQQVGRTYLGGYHAALWSGTAASWVDLNPPPDPGTGYTHSSEAYGVGGGQQVGHVVATGGVTSASLWNGSAASWVNLHPAGAGADISQAFGTDGLQQVGIARIMSTTVVAASLWSGTAGSWVNLNPAGVTTGRANAVHGGQQVGRATVGGVSRASLWSGTAASWVDLHAFLPAEFTGSEAYGISHDGGFTYVVGVGFNSATQRGEALMWVAAAPACCAGDFDGSNTVTDADLPDFVAALLAGDPCPAPPACCPSDFDASGMVDGADMPGFLATLFAGGACP